MIPVGSDELNLGARQVGRVTGKMALVFSCDGEYQIHRLTKWSNLTV